MGLVPAGCKTENSSSCGGSTASYQTHLLFNPDLVLGCADMHWKGKVLGLWGCNDWAEGKPKPPGKSAFLKGDTISYYFFPQNILLVPAGCKTETQAAMAVTCWACVVITTNHLVRVWNQHFASLRDRCFAWPCVLKNNTVCLIRASFRQIQKNTSMGNQACPRKLCIKTMDRKSRWSQKYIKALTSRQVHGAP